MPIVSRKQECIHEWHFEGAILYLLLCTPRRKIQPARSNGKNNHIASLHDNHPCTAQFALQLFLSLHHMQPQQQCNGTTGQPFSTVSPSNGKTEKSGKLCVLLEAFVHRSSLTEEMLTSTEYLLRNLAKGSR